MNNAERLIDSIDWEHLHTANGSAVHVPIALRKINATDKESRKSAYWKLDNNVVLQSDLYDSAYWVLQVLLTLLESSEENGREEILNLLFEIANGYAPDTCLVKTVSGQRIPLKQACMESIRCHKQSLEKLQNELDGSLKQTVTDILNIL